MCRLRGYSLENYVAAIRDDQTLNVFWDIDVAEEWQRSSRPDQFRPHPPGNDAGILGVGGYAAGRRALKLCFLGNKHNEGDWMSRREEPLVRWAEQVGAPQDRQPRPADGGMC